MYRVKRKSAEARLKVQEAQAQGKMAPEVQRLAEEAKAAFWARDPEKLEKIIDEILERLG